MQTEVPYQNIIAGIDSIYVSFFQDVSTSLIDFEELALLQEKIRATPKKETEVVRFGNQQLLLKGHGAYPYSYVLVGKEFELQLSKGMSPSCFVKFNCYALWTKGIEKLACEIRDMFDAMQMLTLQREKVSRVDFAFDHFVPVVDFSDKNVLSKLRKNSSYRTNDILETVKFGSGDVVLRIYDKSKEISEHSGKTWFHQLWRRREDVWRIEFQLRGEFIKVACIQTINQLISFRRDLLFDLATTHSSLRKIGKDSNKSRWKLHPLWASLVDTIETLPRNAPAKPLNRKADLATRIDNIDKVIAGYLKSRAALLGIFNGCEPLNLEASIQELRYAILDEVDPIWFRDEVHERRKKYEVEL